tara:strand:- start:11103 stop:11216 length:114 start_codon:yes stop_codon:yes gene_type:complete
MPASKRYKGETKAAFKKRQAKKGTARKKANKAAKKKY